MPLVKPDQRTIEAALAAIIEPGQVTELRILGVSTQTNRRPHTVRGYFDDMKALTAAAMQYGAIAPACYIVPNPINPVLIARAQNRAADIDDRGSTTADADITRRRWLLIDADPSRPAGISSSDAEHDAAIQRVKEIRDALTSDGWPLPILADSGNGAHLMYRIDEPVDDNDLVKHCLEALDFRFGDDIAHIDLKVFNPARIWKLYGTPARKGDDTPDRPHRVARLLDVPTITENVPTALLQSLAKCAPKPPAPVSRKNLSGHTTEAFDIDKFIGDHALDVDGPRNWNGARKWVFRVCPWDGAHRDRSAYLIQFANGAVDAGCQHNSCSGKGWADLREMLEPGCYDRKPLNGYHATPIARLTNADEPVVDEVSEARAVMTRLLVSAKADPSKVIRAALDDAGTVGALALVAGRDRSAFESALLSLRDVGAKAGDVKALERAIVAEKRKRRGALRVVRQEEMAPLVSIKSILSDTPVPDSAVVPAGWMLGENGIARETISYDGDGAERTSVSVICPVPVVIAGRLRDITKGDESVRLCWLRDNAWRHHNVERKVIANAKAIVDVANVGLPVTSGTSGDLVDYLAAYENANIRDLPRANVSSQMGWVGDAGKLGFLWGRSLITADGLVAASLDPDQASPEEWSDNFVGFRGEDGGDDQIADAFTQLGTFEEWRETVAPIANYPRALLALYAALVPPIQSILECPNFAIDFAFATSTGKTTTLRVAGSCWGCPDERAPSSVIGTWDATRVWIERASTILNGLPLLMDDTKRAKNTKIVAQTVYDVSSGRGKGRGSPRGMRRAGSWCTVLLSTGEAQITSYTEDGGTRARTLEVWGAPFGVANETTTDLVRHLNIGVCSNYGHAGPLFVQWIQQHRDDWPAWREEYRKSQIGYQERAGSNAVASRYAAYFAALDMTAALAHAALELPWDYHDPIDAVWDQLLEGANEADRAAAARDYIVSWAAGHQSEFWGRHMIDNSMNPRTMSEGWAGKWDKGDDWRYIGFLHHRLKSVLTAAGYEADPTIRLWKDRDWLMTDPGRPSLTAKVDGAAVRVIALKREACSDE